LAQKMPAGPHAFRWKHSYKELELAQLAEHADAVALRKIRCILRHECDDATAAAMASFAQRTASWRCRRILRRTSRCGLSTKSSGLAAAPRRDQRIPQLVVQLTTQLAFLELTVQLVHQPALQLTVAVQLALELTAQRTLQLTLQQTMTTVHDSSNGSSTDSSVDGAADGAGGGRHLALAAAMDSSVSSKRPAKHPRSRRASAAGRNRSTCTGGGGGGGGGQAKLGFLGAERVCGGRGRGREGHRHTEGRPRASPKLGEGGAEGQRYWGRDKGGDGGGIGGHRRKL
jgi:hypothetical protein